MTEKELVAKMLDTLVRSRKELANIDLGITKKSLPDLDKIIEHISAPLMIMVMGEFSTGKSTFINAMVGEEVTAMNATPTTAVITKLCYGNQDKILVHFTDGTEKEYKKTAFKHLTSKTGKKNEDKTHAKIEYVERQLPLDMLQYVTIIDSPGLNDINERHSDTTKKFVNNADTVFWMFNALHAGSKTEVDAMEALTPRLKPIAIINMMDEIDEEEDDPQEFLDNLRVQMKDKVQAVVGISAKYALEGKLEKNETKIEIGNLKELEQVVQELVLPNRDKFKLNTLMDELGEWLSSFSINDIEEVNLKNKEIDYEAYLELKANIQHNKEILGKIICDEFKKYIFNESKIFNEQAMFILGVLYEYGITVAKDISQAEQYYEDAAIKNHVLAQAVLGGLYYHDKKDIKKAKYWLEKATAQNSKIALALLGIIYLTDKTTGNVDLQNADLEKALPLLEKAAALEESYALLILSELYFHGVGVSKDEEKACNFLFHSAELGNESALTAAGELFLSSYEKDDEDKDKIIKAIDFFTQAAEYGDEEALFNLGEIYRKYWNGKERDEKSLKYYKKAALLGNADAQLWLAWYYNNGVGLAKDIEQAFVWYQKSAEQENAKAQTMLGRCYEEGWGVEKDSGKAAEWYRMAAEQGDKDAQYNLAICYDEGKGVKQDQKQAAIWFEKAAEQGVPDAQYSIGLCYYVGDGVKKDYKQAMLWFRKAAEQGEINGQIGLGRCYEEGNGVEQDYQQAEFWYKKSAEQGDESAKQALDRLQYLKNIKTNNKKFCTEEWDVNREKNDNETFFEKCKREAENGNVEAQYKLGLYYKNGEGTAKDNAKAYTWFQKAAEAGYLDAKYEYALSLGISSEAFGWFKEAAEAGHAGAQNMLGRFYAEGWVSMNDDELAFEWYLKAANQGLAVAQYNVALSCLRGRGVVQDREVACLWFKEAAKQGHADAQNMLGRAYSEGWGVIRDDKLAFEWYLKAANQGLATAQCNVAMCCLNGRGVAQDRATACLWFKEAAKQNHEFAKKALRDYFDIFM